MKVGIVGAGLQAKRRAPDLLKFPNTKLVLISAEYEKDAKNMASQFGCEHTTGWEWVGRRDDIDAVIVCTPPHLHERISVMAMQAGKHVLCEKPLAKTIDECERMIMVAQQTKKVLKCGFNHRHHPAVLEAKRLTDAGKIGKPLFIRSRYGITGTPERENEWRCDPLKTSGGHLMEQGIHTIDLSRWFLGNFEHIIGFRDSVYWSYPNLEDNGFVLMRTAAGQVASIHASLLQWKNLFSFEIYGEEGYFEIEGLGGSYGVEKLHYGPKDYYKPFEIHTTEYRGADKSWYLEWQEFVQAIEQNRIPLGSATDGLEAMRIVFQAYEFSDQFLQKKEPAKVKTQVHL